MSIDIEELKKLVFNPFNCISISTKNTLIECIEALEQLMKENKELRDGQEWISVEDRLPVVKKPDNNFVKCVVNVNGYGCHIDKFYKEQQQFYKYYGYVTHWKPLPQPPQDK
jgi:hypothetical protein